MSQPIKVYLGCFLECVYSILFVEWAGSLDGKVCGAVGGLQPITFILSTQFMLS